MSSSKHIKTIKIYQGAQGKYYKVKGIKYDINFPLKWALNHKTFPMENYDDDASGPRDCGNCEAYGTIRGVFVGYCCNCIRNYSEYNMSRGVLYAPGLDIASLKNEDMWRRLPYMNGVKKSMIGDEEGADVTDEGIDIEELCNAMNEASENEERVSEEERIR